MFRSFEWSIRDGNHMWNEKVSTNIGNDLIKGLQFLLATYFMYDLEYPTGSKGVLKFLQKRLLGIPLQPITI